MSGESKELKEIRRELSCAIDSWLPKRRETITALERIADKTQNHGRIANRFKLCGNAVGALSGFVSGALGILTIVSTGGLATPFVVAGAGATAAGIAGAVAAGGAEVTKSIVLSNLFQEAQRSINKEIDAYLTVIINIDRLHRHITDKSRIDGGPGEFNYLSGARYFSDAVVNCMAACSNVLHNHFTRLASHAATKAAIATAQETAEVSTEVLAKMAKIATSAADEATNTTVGLLLKHMYQNSTELVIEAAGDKAASEVALAIGKSLSDEAVIAATVQTATVRAAKSAGKSIAKESVSMTGDVLEAGGWRLISTGIQVANKLLPLVNFGFAVWDTVESVKAGYDIAWGCKEEMILREKIEQLKVEANSIINEIFNPLFKKTMIDTPFP